VGTGSGGEDGLRGGIGRVQVPVGLVECRGVGERGVGDYGPEFACAGVEVEVRVGGVEVDCWFIVSYWL